MAHRFEGNSIFITGGSSGIGAALAVAFAHEGAKVAVAGRREELLSAVVEDIQAAGAVGLAVVCDVTDRASLETAVEKTVETFGSLDVAIANAGFGVSGPLEKLTTDDFRRQFDTNVFGVIDTVYATLPHLIASKGRLAIVSSVMGKLGRPAMSAYAASKFALCGFAESIYFELAEQGVSVTCINPGLVESQFRQVDNKGRFHEGRKDPSPSWLVVPKERAARDMVKAVYRRKAEVTITGHGKAAVFVRSHFPGLFRTVLRLATKGRLDAFERALRDTSINRD